MTQVILQHQHISISFSDHDKENSFSSVPIQDLSCEINVNPQDSKQKSQLCRRYMEFGFCPYQKRCKFAHGSHQLLKNNQTNIKYKTKQCENFKKNHFCIYGKRCNFIHNCQPFVGFKKNKQSDIQLQVARKMGKISSRLMQLLKLN